MKIIFPAALALLVLAAPASAEPTPITVRVSAKDGKFVGSGMGGAHIMIRDADTGELLAEGVTQGSTGDTDKLVVEPKARHARLTGEGDAAFRTSIDIDRPRRISIEASGALAQRQSATTASITQWVLPGKPPHGPDGIIIELPGLAVDIAYPIVFGRGIESGDEVPVLANVVLLCGCSLQPGGLWDSDQYEVVYEVTRDGAPFDRGTLVYAGIPSQFEGKFRPVESGNYEVTVAAYHPITGNAGVDQSTVVIP